MITITKRAAEEIELSTHNPDSQGMLIRFAADQTDDGFQYLMGFDERSENDVHLESNGIEYVVSYSQKQLLEGMVVDFDEIDKENGYGFIFMNPNDPKYEKPEKDFAPKCRHNNN
jgi:Fe-S cluster assembly iron-binding protein IscA